MNYMDPAAVFFMNDSVFLTGSWDSIRVIYSFEEEIEFNCPLGFESLPICIGHNNICIPMKEQI